MKFRFLFFVLTDKFGKVIEINKDFEDFINLIGFIVNVISVS
jgi:hypothetical protein